MPELSENKLEQLYQWLTEAHQIVTDPDVDDYFAYERVETLLRQSINILKGEPL
jgi:hypothetical protein